MSIQERLVAHTAIHAVSLSKVAWEYYNRNPNIFQEISEDFQSSPGNFGITVLRLILAQYLRYAKSCMHG